ncbi:DNA polymerase epsilon subunit 3-like [Rhopilema esculentum]|uniref:DNA polymerase epsilon subunit 3-like n=1 Tax=Rhopilema esculentum TaxID=499914 RepID=UPI0031D81E0B
MAEKPEDLNLPHAVITRLIKEVLPDGVNVSKEARSAISRAASVFVLYTTSCANNLAQKQKRKTLTGQDVLTAMEEMEFEQFIEPLKHSLEAFKKEQKGKENKKKEAAEKRKQNQENNEGGDDEKKQKTDDAIEEEAEEAGSGQ